MADDRPEPPPGRGSLPRIDLPPAGSVPPASFDWVWFFFSMHGRIARRHYWLSYVLPFVVNSLALGVADSFLGTFHEESGWGLLSGLFSLAALWPGIAVSVKRVHDRDWSGWFVLIALIPIVGGIWLLIELGFLPGTPGPNRFGPPPPPA